MFTRKTVAQLNCERNQLCDELKNLHDKFQAGAASAAEEARLEELIADESPISKLNAELTEAIRIENGMKAMMNARQTGEVLEHALSAGHGPAYVDADGNYRGRTGGGAGSDGLALLDSTGQWHRSAAFNKPLASARPSNAPSAGELLAFWTTGDDRHLGGKDPMAATTGHSGGSAGGYLLPSTISSEFVDKARSAMVTGRAGVRSIALTSSEMSIVRVASDPTGGYYSELSSITASSPTFSSIVMRPRKFSMLIPISREAVEDGQNLPGILESTATSAIAQALDAAVLRGNGVDEPLGITNTPGVNTEASFGTPASYAKVLSAVRKVFDANYQGSVADLAWVHSPREWQAFAGLVSAGAGADGQPLQIPPKIADLRSFTTTAMPITEGSGAESSMIIGDFSSAVIAFRTGSGVTVDFLNAGSADLAGGGSINAVTDDAQWLRFTIRFDVAVLRPDFFTICSGVTTG